MQLTKKTLSLFLLFTTFLPYTSSKAQENYFRSSFACIQSCYQENNCFSLAKNAFIYYDSGKELLLVSIDLSDFKLEADSLDEWLSEPSDSRLNFIAELRANSLPQSSNHSTKNYKLNGKLNWNGKEIYHIADAILYENAEENLDFKPEENNEFEKLRLYFTLSFLPIELGVDKKTLPLKKTIFIIIENGYINYLRQ